MSIPLVVDARMWAHPGIGRYIRELVKATLETKDAIPMHLLGPDSMNEALKAHQGRYTFQKADAKIYSLAEQLQIPGLTRGAQMLHTPHFNVPIFSKNKWVVTIHDLIYLKDPGPASAYVRFLMRQVEKRADAVLTVSEFSKNEILNAFPALKGRVFVTYEAVSDFFYVKTEESILDYKRKKYDFNKPIILYVGTLKPHKNVAALVRAFTAIQGEIPHDLILAGKKDFKYKELWSLVEANKARVRVIDGLGDDTIRALYGICDVFVLPSLIEGFGLPVLEAMASQAPVIVSSRASLPEVAGDVAQYFDPSDENALAHVIKRVLSDEALRRSMIERGPAHARRFTWARTASETQAVYRKVLSL